MDSIRRQRIVTGRASRARSTTSLGLFLAFLLGLAGEAYGLHHDHADGAVLPEPTSSAEHGHAAHGIPGDTGPPGSPSSGDPAGEESGESQPADRDGPDDPAEGTPCPCLGICHGASASPLPSSPPGMQVQAEPAADATGPADEEGPLRGPVPYLLPFANGPPIG